LGTKITGEKMKNETEILLKLAETKDQIREMRNKTQLIDVRFAIKFSALKAHLASLEWVLGLPITFESDSLLDNDKCPTCKLGRNYKGCENTEFHYPPSGFVSCLGCGKSIGAAVGTCPHCGRKEF
jgi:hypothetical protein